MSAGNGPGISDIFAPGIRFALTRLVAGKADAIAFVEIGPDAVAVQVLGVGTHGVPVLRPDLGHSVPWRAILPELPVSRIPRYERMAGDIDAIPGGDSASVAVEHQLTSLIEIAAMGSPSPGTRWRLDVVLVTRSCPWPLLEAAAARASTVLRPITKVTAPRAVALPDLIRDLAARAPLRYGCDLVVAEVDPTTRVVNPRTRQLFPAGTSVLPDASPETSITVSRVPDHAAAVLALPIVARRGPVSDLRDAGALAEHHPLITMTGLGGRARGPVELRVRLTGPECEVTAPPQRADLTRAGQPGWPELMKDWPGLMKELPHRLPPKKPPWVLSPPGYLDLAVLVELGGAEADVAARVGMARDFVGKFRGVRDAKIAAVGYRDHYGSHHRAANWVRGREADALLVGCSRLTTQDRAASMLAAPGWWDAARAGHPRAAPLEDALMWLTDPDWGWRPRARRMVVVIGSRPPHPAKASEAVRYDPALRPCYYGDCWRTALNHLEKMHPVDRYTVLDRAPDLDHDADRWREFGARECFLLGRGTLGRLTKAAGLVPPPRTQVRLAMVRAMASAGAAGLPSGRAAQ